MLADAGIEVAGENAAGPRAQARALRRPFRWHFIGHLQSRKAKRSSELCELCHSLASESAAKRLAIPAFVEVNLSGEPTKSGVSPDELPRFLELYDDVRGLMTMPPASEDPEASRPYFRRLRELAEAHGLSELSMGTSQDYRVAAEEGATLRPRGIDPLREVGFGNFMALGDLGNRTLVYFGIAEEDEWDDDTAAAEELERSYEERRANVRRLSPRKRERDFDDWTDPGTRGAPGATKRSRARACAAWTRPRRPRSRAGERAPRRARVASTTRSRSPTSSRTRCR